MATRRSISNQSCSSSSIKRMGNSKIRCNCGNQALIKTVRKGPNLGMKFYGCPMWPDTQCDFFKWVNEQAEMEDYEVKLLEKETIIVYN
uniref:GRF-type domain-containing protein n=1 Tax=Chenopodium quinoa TaxID=63459 RepID=A0A803MU48_CHEQI